MADFNKAIEKTLVNEGGYVNDPNDAGGETKYGISKRAYPSVDIKNLTQDGAKEIYKRDYWDRLRADEIKSQKVAFELFDTAVNMGVRTASKLIQGCVGAHPDGVIGEKTLQLINSVDEELLLLRFKLAKIARYAYITRRRPANKKYLLGWINRTLEA
ncbi:glycoside hydrolase family 108 protein [Sulfurimonas sp.]